MNAQTRPEAAQESQPSGTSSAKRSGGRLIAEALRQQGVDRVFCVPGESYIDVLDALYDMRDIEIVVAKHEGAAANMAEADGKLTGRPGICMVTRGPGATHACIGVHTAFHDSTPMVLLIGQVSRRVRDRSGFQEVNFDEMFAPLAKWVAEIPDAARVPEYMARAYHTALSGRPGPVVLSLPEDMLSDTVTLDESDPRTTARIEAPASGPTVEQMQALRAELARAKHPLLIVGGSGWTDEACADLAAFAEANNVPVAASFRRQDLIDNRLSSYVGHLSLDMPPFLASQIKASDLIIALGTRLGDITTRSYSLLEVPVPHARLVHIHPSPDELGQVYRPDLAIASAPPGMARALRALGNIAQSSWQEWASTARKGFVNFATPPADRKLPSGVDMSAVIRYLSDRLPADAIICNGAGNYTVWVHRYFTYKRRATELAPTSGAMGYGLPASIAAKKRYPERVSVCFAGDGCFLMYPQELATAQEFGAAIIVIVVNNGMYGTIRMHQEKRFPGRPSGTNIQDPDFVAMAKSFGAHAERVTATQEFGPAFERALAAGKPTLLELMVDRGQITPDRRLS